MRLCASSACFRDVMSDTATRHHFSGALLEIAEVPLNAAQIGFPCSLNSAASQICFPDPAKARSRKA